ncbi:hypothetical protein [Streptomyces sp. NPDC059378]|uniref:hypothetical protein n=1 Tax=Streptomyces sp. NPDC059378 TaxID=3346815 RepID=UPI003685D81A
MSSSRPPSARAASQSVLSAAQYAADDDPLKSLGITASDVELLTSGWSTVKVVDLDRLACFALHP